MTNYKQILQILKEYNNEEVNKDYRIILICGAYLTKNEFCENLKYGRIANKKIDKFIKKPYNKKDFLSYIKRLDIQDYSVFINGFNDFVQNDKTFQKFNNSELSKSLTKLIFRLYELKEEDTILDLCCKSGFFLNNIKVIAKDEYSIKTIGIDINQDQCEIASILLEISDSSYSIYNEDVIKDLNCPSFDKCLIFPPFGIKFDEKISDKYSKSSEELINQRSSSEWFYIYNALKSLGNDSKIIAIVSDNALFKTYDSNIRKYLIENNLIEGIISLPNDSIKGLSIKTNLLILSKNNEFIKILDGNEFLSNSDNELYLEKNDVYDEIFNKYNDNCVLKIKKEDIKTIDYNLTYKSLSSKNLYKNLSDLKSLDEICDILKGCNLTYTNFKDEITEEETNYKVLNSGDIDDNGFIDIRKLKNLRNGEKYNKYLAKNGDIVLTSKSTKIKVGLINCDDNINIVVASSMIILRPKQEVINPIYLKMFFDSKQGKKMLEFVQIGVNIVIISTKELSLLKIPCPSLEKQNKEAEVYKKRMEIYELKKKEIQKIELILENFYDLYLKKEN